MRVPTLRPLRRCSRGLAARRLLAMACLALMGALPALADPAGQVELASGTVSIVTPNGWRRSPGIGDLVNEGERIVTASDGELQLRMEDNGYLAIRPDSELVIGAYRANGDDQDNVLLELVVGTFRSITGWVGRYHRDHYKVSTPNATIGVRGTDHEPLVVTVATAALHPGLEAGTYDKVNEGGTVIRNALGSIAVDPGQVALATAQHLPVRLRRLPALYRPSVNEALIDRIKPELLRNLDDRRRQKLLDRLRHNGDGENDAPDGAVPDALKDKLKSGEISRQKAKQIIRRHNNR